MNPLRWMAAAAAVAAAAVQAAPQAMSDLEARHLLLRTGFAATEAEVARITGQSARRAVTDMVARARLSRPEHPAPPFVSEPPPTPLAQLGSPDQRLAARREQYQEGLELKTWWLREMIESPTPLQERMTLFWHGHFATSQQKVVRSQAMWRQHLLLRSQALGNFRELLHGIAKDPAMLVYLDGANSRKEAPNENFAREVMELFTLGETSQGGGYTEQDIKEAARAFTGWSVERSDFSYRYRAFFHDGGSKVVFGRNGYFDGDAVLDLILDQPQAARFIVGKLWKEFISPEPEAAEVDRIAQRFRGSGFDIGLAVSDLLMTDAFWASANRGALIKSPVELVVGTVRQFGFSYTDAAPFALEVARLGQNLLAPPNVKGWPGYTEWINATTLLERKRFSEQLFRAVEFAGDGAMDMGGMPPGARMAEDETSRQALRLLGRGGPARMADAMSRVRFDPDKWMAQYGGHTDREPSDSLKARLEGVVLAAPPTQAIAAGTVGVAWIRALTMDPAYQLK